MRVRSRLHRSNCGCAETLTELKFNSNDVPTFTAFQVKTSWMLFHKHANRGTKQILGKVWQGKLSKLCRKKKQEPLCQISRHVIVYAILTSRSSGKCLQEWSLFLAFFLYACASCCVSDHPTTCLPRWLVRVGWSDWVRGLTLSPTLLSFWNERYPCTSPILTRSFFFCFFKWSNSRLDKFGI